MTRYNPNLKPRPTVYKGVQMRSRLEAQCAAGMDKLGVNWAYEPRAFADERGQYLPDFELTGPRSAFYLEVKPVAETEIVEDVFRRMQIIRSSEPEATLAFASPELRSLVIIDAPWGVSVAGWFVLGTGTVPVCFGEIESGNAKGAAMLADAVASGVAYGKFDWSWKPNLG